MKSQVLIQIDGIQMPWGEAQQLYYRNVIEVILMPVAGFLSLQKENSFV